MTLLGRLPAIGIIIGALCPVFLFETLLIFSHVPGAGEGCLFAPYRVKHFSPASCFFYGITILGQ